MNPFSFFKKRKYTMEDLAKQHIADYIKILVDKFNYLNNTNIETEIYTDESEEIIEIDITVPYATIGIHATFATERFFNINLVKELSIEFISILDMYIKEKDSMHCVCCENVNLTEEEREFEHMMRNLTNVSSIEKDSEDNN
jgi:hypothetical protein